MTDAPPPDFHVDPELAARLVAAQHPDLAGPVRHAAGGWDNVLFRLGERYAVRMPRRHEGVGLMWNEQRWLPELAAALPVPVPAPVRVGRPAPELGYDVPWSIVPWFDGQSGLSFDLETRGVAASALAGFVAELSATPAPVDAPSNPYRGVPLARRDAAIRARLTGGRIPDADRLLRVWERALAASEWTGPPVWLHGDLHPHNVLLAPSGFLVAVVDFGDLTAGDPATDLATAWLTFDARSRRRFRSELEVRRGVDEATWDRARGWALVIASAVVEMSSPASRFGSVAAEELAQVLLD
ncbi:aminoglycoside phosphotransferase (APT) family kinase protein [Agromyces sp. 3263]|uniref:aminoglycoside phosphotransferase family protein n=1 Tax=Agromyces sp. 3263 TaxID=2817750 RepID=UPI0028600B72|nr:aminoglycoside phosphotransferase family protein [Agromyces sp. 3263]MDR6905877.1 aminoglycoside phosphotransferase (APT) family kinase protein [Agromyces sp. 3263]